MEKLKKKDDKKGKGKPGAAAVAAPSADDLAADEILREINAFHDPSGGYDYSGDTERPDFLISNQELQNRYMNLNTSNANKIARSEHFQKILISWVNKHLEKRKLSITNLHSDLQNGVALINLLEEVSGQEIKKYYKEPKHIPHQLENLEIVLKFLVVLGLPIKAECQDLYHGRLGVICGMLFMIIQKFKDGEDKGKKKKVDIKVAKIGAAEAALRLREAAAREAAAASSSSSGSSSFPAAPASATAGLPPPPGTASSPFSTPREFAGFEAIKADYKAKYSTSLTPMARVPFVGEFPAAPGPRTSLAGDLPSAPGPRMSLAGDLPSPSSISRLSPFSSLPPPPTALSGLPPPPTVLGGLPPPLTALGGFPPQPTSARDAHPDAHSNHFPAPPPAGGLPPPPSSLSGARPGPPTGLPPPAAGGHRPSAASSHLPPPPPSSIPAPLTLESINASAQGDLSLDDLDDLNLDADILDLENFHVNSSTLIDIDKSDLLKDLEGMKSFLDSMADEQELTLDDLDLDFDDIL